MKTYEKPPSASCLSTRRLVPRSSAMRSRESQHTRRHDAHASVSASMAPRRRRPRTDAEGKEKEPRAAVVALLVENHEAFDGEVRWWVGQPSVPKAPLPPLEPLPLRRMVERRGGSWEAGGYSKAAKASDKIIRCS